MVFFQLRQFQNRFQKTEARCAWQAPEAEKPHEEDRKPAVGQVQIGGEQRIAIVAVGLQITQAGSGRGEDKAPVAGGRNGLGDRDLCETHTEEGCFCYLIHGGKKVLRETG